MTKKKQRSLPQLDASSLPPGVKLLRKFSASVSDGARIKWSADGAKLASPAKKYMVKVWDVQTGKCLMTLGGHSGSVKSVAFSPDGRMLASSSQDSTVRIWDLANQLSLVVLEGHKESVEDVSWSNDGRFLASVSRDHELIIWNARSFKPVHRVHQRSIILGLAWTADSTKLATAAYESLIFDVATGQGITVPARGAFDVSFLPEPSSSLLATANLGGVVTLWDFVTGKQLMELEGHTSFVTSVSFSHDAKYLASASQKEIRLWSCGDWRPLLSIVFRWRSDVRARVAFHPGLYRIAVLSGKGALQIWELDFDQILTQPHEATISYTSAKVVMVGESNVGKSYLAHRIATGKAPQKGKIKSTHGMTFWPMEPGRLDPSAKAPEGQRRDVVLWDMGGQEEYRLVHQLFLRDTTVALVLFDPTRGLTAIKEVETWNKYLEKQLGNRLAKKLLVGAKLDRPVDTIDLPAVNRLKEESGFAGYYESSAFTGRGLTELSKALSQAIDWDHLGKTSRPEFFQQIRDYIESRRKKGDVVLPLRELKEQFTSKASDSGRKRSGRINTVQAVADQLAMQGLIAQSKTSSGEPVLVLQVQEIERYAGSLIIAARKNPRGVPALELSALARADFPLPGITKKDRLSSELERPVIECTVQLLLEHGICFEHEGLLIFPTLFAPTTAGEQMTLPSSVSLYYDFAGAIDNIYASLVAWLVLARDFGRVRLWADRAEFEVEDGGLCGLYKVGRPGGFAHLDVYFESATPTRKQELFVSFVEEHLRQSGVEIKEHVALTCLCTHKFEEETLRQRIARGERDVQCPVCETRHSLTEGAAESRERDSKIAKQTWALKTKIEKRRQKTTEVALEVIEKATETRIIDRPIRLLHLSDLHFTSATPIEARLQWLLDDLKRDEGLGFKQVDYLVVSGDFTDKGNTDGFEKAYEFISRLTQEFGLSAERCILVPGNHDVVDRLDAYTRRKDESGLKAGEWFREGKLIMAQDHAIYPLRFKPFSDSFYHKFLQRPYPTGYVDQGNAIPFWETGIQFIALNSCWQIDEFNRKRSSISPEAVARALKEAQQQLEDAQKIGTFGSDKPLLRIATWHHAVAGPEQMKNVDFIGNLQKNGVRIALHGDVHEMRRDLIGYIHQKRIHIVGSGSFGAPGEDRPESTPRLYNALEIRRDLTSARVHTRCQPKVDGAWDGYYEWPDPNGKGRLPYYDIDLVNV